MIIYNVTVNIENDVHDEWLKWMQEIHIPDVMKTGLFTGSQILRILADEDSGGTSYAIQYTCANMQDYEKYRDEFAPALQKEVAEKYKDKFVAFRTLLETV
ncbi:MAG TPA: DUF4286 family protein [Bacteroidia bacterium]|nr:DUF4286 family protein [Bacteroidia bacterium]